MVYLRDCDCQMAQAVTRETSELAAKRSRHLRVKLVGHESTLDIHSRLSLEGRNKKSPVNVDALDCC